jgi:hypothetical protein
MSPSRMRVFVQRNDKFMSLPSSLMTCEVITDFSP